MVSTWLVKCGIFTYSNWLSEALQNLGIDVTILAEQPFPNNSAIDETFQTKIPATVCWSRQDNFEKLIEESRKYDLIHISHQYGLFPNENNFLNLLKNISPAVITLHDVIPYDVRMERYFKGIIEFCKNIIVHLPICYNLLESWNCPKEKIHLIPHGTKIVEVSSKEESRKKLNEIWKKTIFEGKEKVILSWGFIWESKGIKDLIEIFSEVLKTYPDSIFIHAGGVHPIIAGSDYLKSLIKKAMQLNLTPKNFMVTGFVPEEIVPLYFGACDVIVLNYARGSASASGAAHRTLSAHRPIVGTDDPCISDIPKLESSRFDKNSLYQNILKVLETPALERSLAEEAFEKAQQTSWENVAKQHIKIYEEMIKK